MTARPIKEWEALREKIGMLLIFERRAAGLTQAEGARLLRVPRQNLNAWECGRRLPRRATLARCLLAYEKATSAGAK